MDETESDEKQAGLADFRADDGVAEDDGRDVAAEAAAVAGNGDGAADVVDLEDVRYPDADEYETLAVTQIDYTVEGRGDDEFPVVHVFGRTPDDERAVHVEVYEFDPYFYAPTDSLTDADLQRDRITGWEETDENGDPYESIRGERLTKIFGQTPRDVGQMREEFDHYEADILFPNRLLIDKDITSGVRVPARRETADGPIRVPHDELEPVDASVDPRVNTFDIEVDDRQGFPEEGEETIVCLTSHDSYDDQYIVWLYDSPAGIDPPEALDAYDPIEDDFEADVRVFEEEEAMLEAFVEYVEETDPDVLTGWNFDDFDAPYFLDRMEALQGPHHDYDLSIDRLSRVDEVWRSNWQGPDIKGRVVFDLLYAYQRTKFSELDSYRLDAVGEQELGVGKERYPGDIGDLWEDDPERLLEYNLRDVELCVELNEQQNIIPFWLEVASFVGCKLEDATTPGDAVDMYVLHKLHGNFALPSKGKHDAEDYEGGAVFDPITGVRENVTVLDLKCFSPDTDVLTPDGPKNIAEIDEGEDVYTLNPETFECEVKPVAETHEYENKFGELHHLAGNTHDFKITENHRMLYSKERGWDEQRPADFEFAEYRDIPEYERYAFPQHEPMVGHSPETFDLVDEVDAGHVVAYYEDDLREFRHRMPEQVTDSLDLVHGSSEAMGLQKKVGKYLVPVSVYHDHRDVIEEHADEVFLKYDAQHRETPCSFAMANWLELVGWYVTEGSADRTAGRIVLHQDTDSEREAICRLLDQMGINYNVDETGVNVSNEYLLDWFVENCGKGYSEKRIPEWMFDLDGELLTVLLNTMIRGDGSRTGSGLGKFRTKSDALKDGIATVAVRCGHKPTVSKQSDGTWYVSIGKRGSFKKSTNAAVEEHAGNVHCITAEDNHVVLAGRNGNFQWIGQSLYPMCMVTTNASPETKVDPDAYDGDTFRAPNGQHFRKEPDGVIREMVDELLSEREEKKSLRNDHDPDSAVYEQYDRQQAAVKVIMNCFTPDTDVLTPAGVRNIRDLEVGDEVYSLDPDTMRMEVKPVVETHAYPDYRGELVDIETSKIDFSVTPNHRMLVRKNETNGITEDEYRFVEAGELDDATNYELPHDWDGPSGRELDEIDLTEHLDGDYQVWVRPEVHGHTFAAEIGYYPDKVLKNDIGEEGYVFDAAEFEEHREYIEEVADRTYVHAEAGRKWIPRTYDGDDFLSLLAWYTTEGNVYTSETKEFGEKLRGSATTIQIAQDAIADGGGSHHERIGDLLDGMGFDYYVDEKSYQFTSQLLGEFLERVCGAGSFEKRIPEFVFETSDEQKRAFLETLIAGDGDWQENSWRYSTVSERLRDDVLRLCAHLGLTANYNEDSGTYRIYVTEDSKNTLRMHRSSDRSTAADGVYCVTVEDNHTMMAGRNGKFQFVGQSLYGVLGWDRFRLYDKEMGAAVTATGRDVIEYTDEVARKQGYEVVYGDSVTGDRPVVVRDPDGMVRVLPIEDIFERGRMAVASADSGIAVDGGAVTATNREKDRRLLDGWEALSISDTGEPEWRRITQAIRHETDKPVVKLQHKFGESTTTRDHSYVVEEDGELVESCPEDVEEPLRVPGVPAVETVDKIDVYEVLNGYTRTYEDGRSVGSENATKKTKRVHADDEWVWFGHEHHDSLDKTVRVKRHIELDSEEGKALVRLLGAYVTEGSASTAETTDSRYGASICESRREWLEQLERDYDCLFANTTASIVRSDTTDSRTVEYETSDGLTETTYDDGTYKLQMMNELAAVFFREFAGQRSRGKRVPSMVFHLSEELQSLFIHVMVEGDGSREFPRYSEEYSDRNFDFETASRELAAGLSMLLTQRDEKHSLKYRNSKGTYTVRTCDYYRSGRDPVTQEVEHDGYVYDLSVEENENFVDAVGGVVLHNTDSVMLEVGSTSPDDVDGDVEITDEMREKHPEMDDDELLTIAATIQKGFELEEVINDSYDDFALEQLNAEFHRFEIEFEKLYRRFFQAGKKKRYAGHIVWKEGKDVDDVDITGFEYQRSDIAPITKRVQKNVIDRIVHGEDAENIKTYVHDVIADFQDGNVDPEDVGIPGGIGQKLDNYDTDTAQVRGAKYANLLLGTNFGRGSKPKRLYLRRVHDDFFQRVEDELDLDPSTDPLYGEFKRDPDVICFEYADQLPEEFAVDWEKMLDKTLKGPIERILEALDISWDEVKSGQEQTGLGQYM
jgi:DNA polymerase I